MTREVEEAYEYRWNLRNGVLSLPAGPAPSGRGGALGIFDRTLNALLAAEQDVSEDALTAAEAIALPEVRRMLGSGDDIDAATLAEKLLAVRDAAAAAGHDAVFRVGRSGAIEAVHRAPEMAAGGSKAWRALAGLERVLGGTGA